MGDTPSGWPTRPSLLRRIRDPGDTQSWRTFVDLYGPLIYRHARSRGLQGTVYLEIFIKSDGAIGDVSVTSSSSHPLLDEAALEAVRSLAPQPFPKGLKPRPLRVRLPVVFDLH